MFCSDVHSLLYQRKGFGFFNRGKHTDWMWGARALIGDSSSDSSLIFLLNANFSSKTGFQPLHWLGPIGPLKWGESGSPTATARLLISWHSWSGSASGAPLLVGHPTCSHMAWWKNHISLPSGAELRSRHHQPWACLLLILAIQLLGLVLSSALSVLKCKKKRVFGGFSLGDVGLKNNHVINKT